MTTPSIKRILAKKLETIDISFEKINELTKFLVDNQNSALLTSEAIFEQMRKVFIQISQKLTSSESPREENCPTLLNRLNLKVLQNELSRASRKGHR